MTRIDYAGDGVTVATSGGETLTADRVIVTLPLALLQEDAVTFNPPLPEAKTTAISRLGAGLIEKVQSKEAVDLSFRTVLRRTMHKLLHFDWLLNRLTAMSRFLNKCHSLTMKRVNNAPVCSPPARWRCSFRRGSGTGR